MSPWQAAAASGGEAESLAIQGEPTQPSSAEFASDGDLGRSSTPKILLTVLALMFAGWMIVQFSGGNESGMYLLADSPTYSLRSSSSARDGVMEYGTMVNVAPTSEAEWVMITEGEFEGDFLPAAMLAENRPLTLSRMGAGEKQADTAFVLRNRPHGSADGIGSVGSAQRFETLGTVVNDLSERWYLLIDRSSDVPRAAFALVSATQAENTGEGEDEIEPEPTPEPTAIAAEADSCESGPTPFAKLICRSSVAGNIERRLRRAHSDLCRTARQSGQACDPLSQYTASLERCANLSCAERAVSRQVRIISDQKATIAAQARTQPPATPQASRNFDRAAATQPPAAPQNRNATPRNLGRWANRIQSNYPSSALRKEIGGTVGVTVVVGPNGRVSNCSVTSSSGESSLDQAACEGFRRYGRFNPALDAAGNPTAGSYSTSITYRIN